MLGLILLLHHIWTNYHTYISLKDLYDFHFALMDSYTKVLAWHLMKQLRKIWRSGVVDMALIKA